MQNITDVELIKLKAEAVDAGHLKLATWGTKEQLIHVLRYGSEDQYQNNYGNA